MSKSITSGKERNTLSRIYDRLRKASQRKLGGEYAYRTEPGGRYKPDIYRPFDHEAYTSGVRDALNAVEKDNR